MSLTKRPVVQKTPYFRSESFRRAVASMDCVNCGQSQNSQAAHNNQASSGKGMGIKSSDETCMALCCGCHAWLDQGGTMSKMEKQDFENEMSLRTLRRMVATGLLVVRK